MDEQSPDPNDAPLPGMDELFLVGTDALHALFDAFEHESTLDALLGAGLLTDSAFASFG